MHVSSRGPSASPTSADATGSERARRILVAEDDREMRRLLVEALREDGYEVDEAPDGVELLAHIGSSVLFGTFGSVREPPDLIVTDVRMPGLTGLTVLAALRESGETVPVIVITAFGDDETHRFAHEHGAVAIFDKPFDLVDLRAAIDAVLRTAAHGQPGAAR
ncbi:MAG: response regulator [bacterium]